MYMADDIVKRLDEVAALLHRYCFALIGERDGLIARAYDIVTSLSLDIVIDKACSRDFSDES